MATENWLEHFKGLSSLDDATKDVLISQSSITQLKEGTRIFGPGQAPHALLFLMEGQVKVQQTAENGRELVLYRVNAGESCILTTACLLAYDDYLAEGIAEKHIKAAMLPRNVFNQLIAQSDGFRQFLFFAYSRRITDLFRIIEDVAFKRIDIRLAEKLLAFIDESNNRDVGVSATHMKLATELGTAREVISRQLQEFQNSGWIALSRGSITILDQAALQNLAKN